MAAHPGGLESTDAPVAPRRGQRFRPSVTPAKSLLWPVAMPCLSLTCFAILVQLLSSSMQAVLGLYLWQGVGLVSYLAY